ncbi:MAG: hypothetical protein E7172_04525 [Firmicutes bacterium]|nr:hypothetical protein [Bacillota bacterium]
MDKLNEIIQELGISKVKLAKYLGVSRQMVYNYLELDDINKWPKEKKVLMFQLLGVQSEKIDSLKKIKVTPTYLMEVEKRLNDSVKEITGLESFFDLSNLNKNAKNILNDITTIIKEKLEDDEDDDENFHAMQYLYYLLQSIDNIPEVKYIFAYMAKSNCFINPNEFKFDEDKQYIFEGILFSALSIYNNGRVSKSKIVESRTKFLEDIEQKNEEKLSRTQQLKSVQSQALKELGYNAFNTTNASEVIEKIVEIESRKV